NFAGIDDYEIFDNATVNIGEPQPWPESQTYNQVKLPEDLSSMMESLRSVALLAIKNDSVLYEKYWDGYSDSSLSGSFSVAKSITSLLIGAAIKEGKIKSVDDLVGDYLPE